MYHTFFRLRAYLKYRKRARRGVLHHSPFIYELSCNIFEPHLPEPLWQEFESQYREMSGICLDRVSKKNGNMLSRMASYFDAKTVTVIGRRHKADPLQRYFTTFYKGSEKSSSRTDITIATATGATESELEHYFTTVVKYAADNNVFVLEGIRSSPIASEMWERIKAEPRVTVTIDLHRMGLAFFRKESSKEDFVIKY